MTIERDLRRTLRRKPAPADFANRVLARLDGTNASRATIVSIPHRRPAVRWLAAAAALTLVTLGGARYYDYRQTIAEAERVQNEVRLALQIAGETLAFVQRKLQEHRGSEAP